ncbi:hypothetical protein NC651_034277 [Populus alba x Populus x berolinensis]|nr:hypothetical protein NC651_034277 [Populus alba x Populus x berolinensis]
MVLIFIIVREEIIDCIRGEGRVDRQKVKHIPNTSYYFQTQSGLTCSISSQMHHGLVKGPLQPEHCC